MNKTVGKSNSTKATKTTKKRSAKSTTKVMPKTTAKTTSNIKAKKKRFLNFNIKNDNNVLIICVVIIVVILVIALLASVVKNRKVDIEADLTIASASTSCDLIVREDDGTRPASGSTIVVKDSKSYRDIGVKTIRLMK